MPVTQLKSEVFPEPLGPITARVSPSTMATPTSWRALIPPKLSETSLTSVSPPSLIRARCAVSWAVSSAKTGGEPAAARPRVFSGRGQGPRLEVRLEELVRRDHGVGVVRRFIRPHQTHGIQPVVLIWPKGDRRRHAHAVEVLEALHALDEALAVEISAGPPDPLERQHHGRRPRECRVLFADELGLVLRDDLQNLLAGRLIRGGLKAREVGAFPQLAKQLVHNEVVAEREGGDHLGPVANLGHLLHDVGAVGDRGIDDDRVGAGLLELERMGAQLAVRDLIGYGRGQGRLAARVLEAAVDALEAALAVLVVLVEHRHFLRSKLVDGEGAQEVTLVDVVRVVHEDVAELVLGLPG